MEENTVMTKEMENTTPETVTCDESYDDSGSGLGGVLLGSALTIAAFGVVKAGKWAWRKIKGSKKKDESKEEDQEDSESEETETSDAKKKK